MQVDGPPRKSGRPKRTWIKVVRLDLKKCNLSEDLAQDRSEWKNRVYVVNPNKIEKGFDDDDDDFTQK